MLAAAETAGAGAWWCLGDLVGYGADPVRTLAACTNGAERCLAGNHDLGASGRLPLDHFASWALTALEWTQRELGEERCAQLATLEPSDLGGDVPLHHASAHDPVWEYVIEGAQALALLEDQAAALSFHGHTHTPAVWRLGHERGVTLTVPGGRERIEVGPGRLLVNPGAVGQPRDRDPRAAWALYDPGGAWIEFRRTDYDVAGAQAAIRAAGLPELLAARLEEGK